MDIDTAEFIGAELSAVASGGEGVISILPEPAALFDAIIDTEDASAAPVRHTPPATSSLARLVIFLSSSSRRLE
ncbi:hypothetical protein [Sphingomonas sp. MS122]|uniref:hypothetical protein n=1 Tax=Sphingomonas sp. MS122 TaxID=3412683 RepID=UPI003C2EFC42